MIIIIMISLITLFVASQLNYKSGQSTNHIFINMKHFTISIFNKIFEKVIRGHDGFLSDGA